jgi:hypothetical protein
MSPPLKIEVSDLTYGGELVESLLRQGFPAQLVEDPAGWRVEVSSPREDASQLAADLREAIDRWLPDAGIRARIGPVQ